MATFRDTTKMVVGHAPRLTRLQKRQLEQQKEFMRLSGGRTISEAVRWALDSSLPPVSAEDLVDLEQTTGSTIDSDEFRRLMYPPITDAELNKGRTRAKTTTVTPTTSTEQTTRPVKVEAGHADYEAEAYTTDDDFDSDSDISEISLSSTDTLDDFNTHGVANDLEKIADGFSAATRHLHRLARKFPDLPKSSSRKVLARLPVPMTLFDPKEKLVKYEGEAAPTEDKGPLNGTLLERLIYDKLMTYSEKELRLMLAAGERLFLTGDDREPFVTELAKEYQVPRARLGALIKGVPKREGGTQTRKRKAEATATVSKPPGEEDQPSQILPTEPTFEEAEEAEEADQ